ncbi:hypothetical protein HHK36_029290 [Tetracentron sinense]|uniref:Endonuclease/exonuclease/phosphatase domain-containing protein n=1 Tax=Tetracentron sinense TaxID=13715 RepID=A0A835D3F4_TETSI|nr:hypothetical protein HHK36_029290 [Tetracentron sinense]
MVVDSNFVKSNSTGHDSKLKGRISRLGSCASSMTDSYISCTTFNILAPIYKRLDKENQSCRESEYRAYWLTRNQSILDRLLYERSSIICLQEFWVGNEELVHMYEKRLGDAGYINFKLARTNNRGDGLLTAVLKDYFRVLNYRELLFNDFGDRVAQLLHVESNVPFSQSRNSNIQQEILIVNTHLLFPHNSSLSIARLQQVYKILQYVESYQKENKLNPMPIILCGDWNGSKRGHVYKFLRSQGFVSSYDTAHQYTDSDADAHKWVSHRNHRGNICGVDFIWLLNPNKYRKPLKTSWSEAVFGIIKYQLRKASLTEHDAFAFLKADNQGVYVTSSSFYEALRQLNLTGHPGGLSAEETEDLWIQVDTDGNDVVDYEEFQVTSVQRIWKSEGFTSPEFVQVPNRNGLEGSSTWRVLAIQCVGAVKCKQYTFWLLMPTLQRIWNPTWSEQTEVNINEGGKDVVKGTEEQAMGFNVKNAVLFPSEVEKGKWPENYSLSDHARLTVVFSPVRMPCSRPIW